MSRVMWFVTTVENCYKLLDYEKLLYEQEGCCVDRSIPDTDQQTQIFVS